MAKLRPLGDKILVRRVEAETKTKSGIVLPDSAKEKPKRGKIISLGDGKRLESGERAPWNVKKVRRPRVMHRWSMGHLRSIQGAHAGGCRIICAFLEKG